MGRGKRNGNLNTLQSCGPSCRKEKEGSMCKHLGELEIKNILFLIITGQAYIPRPCHRLKLKN